MMIKGWLSLPVRNPREVGAWYQRLGLQVIGGRPDVGIVVIGTPKDIPWEWRHAYTQDPSGHVVEICSPLPSGRDVDSALMR